MASIPIKINSILAGQAPSQYFGEEGSFISSIGIDPDFPISSSTIKTSGFAVPVAYSKFSSTPVNTAVIALINTPKNNLTYAVTSGGKLISYSSTFGSETTVGTVTGSTAGGAAYYNNYIYIFGTGASANDVSRYGPLNNSPSLVNGVWTGATLGSQAVMSDTTYPSLRSVEIPNHFGFVHGDNALYFCDYESKSGGSFPGQGLLHKIRTTKTTDEGDTNNSSSYGALRLPFGFYPTSITNVSTYLMIVGIYCTDTDIRQGTAAFILWDPTNATSFFLGPVPLQDTLATACLNTGGKVLIWSGNSQNGVRISQYAGGDSVNEILVQEEGLPPFSGAVAGNGSRVVWGGFSSNPNTAGCVWSIGSKDPRLPMGLHNVVKTSSTGATPIVTALKFSQQDSYKQPKVIVAWNDASGQGIDKYASNATLVSNLRWVFNIGQKFEIKRIRLPFAGAVGSSTTITPAIYIDDSVSAVSPALPVINNTNFPSAKKVLYKGATLDNYTGINRFTLELAWTSTDPLPVAMPILIDVDVKDDEQ